MDNNFPLENSMKNLTVFVFLFFMQAIAHGKSAYAIVQEFIEISNIVMSY